jgi:iron complex outermembrane receptor protein
MARRRQADLSGRSTVYFTYSTGFLTGGFSGGGLQAFSPTTAEASEIGSKNVFFDDTLRLNVSVYDSDYSNVVTQKPTQSAASSSRRPPTPARSGPSARRRSWTSIPWTVAYLGFHGPYTDAHFGDVTAAKSLNEGGNTVVNGFQLEEFQVPLNPTRTLTGVVSYEFDLGEVGVLAPSATVFRSSRYRTSGQPYFFAYQKTYTTLDAFVRWKPSADSKYSVLDLVGEDLAPDGNFVGDGPRGGLRCRGLARELRNPECGDEPAERHSPTDGMPAAR